MYDRLWGPRFLQVRDPRRGAAHPSGLNIHVSLNDDIKDVHLCVDQLGTRTSTKSDREDPKSTQSVVRTTQTRHAALFTHCQSISSLKNCVLYSPTIHFNISADCPNPPSNSGIINSHPSLQLITPAVGSSPNNPSTLIRVLRLINSALSG